MTALRKYLTLVSAGLWRPAEGDQRREVVVVFGEATLILKDPVSDRPLSHWSLPAVERANPGQRPALYLPGEDADESLEVEDETLIDALETLRAAIRRETPRQGALRGWLLAGGGLLVGALAVLWLPGALYHHAASVVPPALRAEIGRQALADLARVTGPPCANPAATDALAALSFRLFGPEGEGRLLVLRDGPAPALHLPGRLIALRADLIEDHDSPEIVAGFALAEAERDRLQDPLEGILHHAGVFATVALLTSGSLPPQALAGHAEALVSAAPIPVPPEALLARFDAAGVASSPYAYALDKTGERGLALIEADPFAGRTAPLILSDGDWITLQGICDK